MRQSRPYTFDRVVRILATLAMIAGAIWLINVLANVLLPFSLACLIAYILEPIVCFVQKITRIKGRILPILITLAVVTAVLIGIGYLVVPSSVNELKQLEAMIKSDPGDKGGISFLPDDVIRTITDYLSSLNLTQMLEDSRLRMLLTTGGSFLSAVVDFLLHTLEWLLTFIYVIFILLDYEHLMKGFRLLVPPKYRKVAYKVGDDIKDSMNRYFRGQALIALCAAVFYCIGFSIVGIPMALVLGILTGVLYLIPYFQYVTLIPVALVCFISSMAGEASFWPELGKCLIVYAVTQSICDYVLTPKIMGKTMGLNPAIILLSLSVWGTLLGLIGMIIALPLTTLLLSYYQQYVINRPDVSQDEKDQTVDTLNDITNADKP